MSPARSTLRYEPALVESSVRGLRRFHEDGPEGTRHRGTAEREDHGHERPRGGPSEVPQHDAVEPHDHGGHEETDRVRERQSHAGGFGEHRRGHQRGDLIEYKRNGASDGAGKYRDGGYDRGWTPDHKLGYAIETTGRQAHDRQNRRYVAISNKVHLFVDRLHLPKRFDTEESQDESECDGRGQSNRQGTFKDRKIDRYRDHVISQK